MIDRIVARVNDDVITLSELQEEGLPLFERLRENYTGKELAEQVQRAEREFLDQLILRRLQLQYANQIGITASDNEINAALKDVLTRNNLTQEQLTDLLTREGLTLQDYKDRLREQIILARLMNQAVRSRVSVDASEVEAYFKAHQDEFNQPAQARMRHIFFRIDPGAGTTADGGCACTCHPCAAGGQEWGRFRRSGAAPLRGCYRSQWRRSGIHQARAGAARVRRGHLHHARRAISAMSSARPMACTSSRSKPSV